MAKSLRIGIPVALQDGFIQVAFIVITIIASRRGLTDAAAVGIVEKVIGFLFLVPSSMLSAVSALGRKTSGLKNSTARSKHYGAPWEQPCCTARWFPSRRSMSPFPSSERSQTTRRSPKRAGRIFAAMCGTACSRGCRSVSAAIFARRADPNCRFCTISFQ